MKIELIRLQSGEQVLFEVGTRETLDHLIGLKNPVALVPSQDGNIQFAPFAPLADKDMEVVLRRETVVYYAKPNEQLVQNYKEIFSPIITPQNAGKIIT